MDEGRPWDDGRASGGGPGGIGDRVYGGKVLHAGLADGLGPG
jgi:hypothetical protein